MTGREQAGRTGGEGHLIQQREQQDTTTAGQPQQVDQPDIIYLLIYMINIGRLYIFCLQFM